jgi:hypothetical protein
MCEAEGMGLCPWGALGRGAFKSEEEFNAADREGRKMGPQTEEQRRIASKLDELAKKKGTQITSIALAYIMHKAPYVFPIVGIRKVEHLQGNIEALSVELTDEEVDGIEAAQHFDLGFPGNFLMEMGGAKYSTRFTVKDMGMNRFVLPVLDRLFRRLPAQNTDVSQSRGVSRGSAQAETNTANAGREGLPQRRTKGLKVARVDSFLLRLDRR